MNAYEKITQLVIEKLKQGTVPWRRPWSTGCEVGRNMITGKQYRGINALLTTMSSFQSPLWMTYNQARSIGGSVRKGEKGLPIVFFSFIEEETDGELERRPMMRQYVIFNRCQIEGLPEELQADRREIVSGAARQIVEDIKDPPTIVHGSHGAFYSPTQDKISMPNPESFESEAEYFSTLYHELGHSTGAAHRLARKGITDGAAFAAHEYSHEELVAEFTATFLCAEAGIDSLTIDNSAAYIGHWLEVLKKDSRTLVIAAAQGQKAADLLLGRQRVADKDESIQSAA